MTQNNADMPELLPCPFCGKAAIRKKNAAKNFPEQIMCPSGHASTGMLETDPVIAWNTRSPSPVAEGDAVLQASIGNLRKDVFTAVDNNPYVHGVDALACAGFVIDYLHSKGLILSAPLPEKGDASINLETLKWWRELAVINPADLVARIDARVKTLEGDK